MERRSFVLLMAALMLCTVFFIGNDVRMSEGTGSLGRGAGPTLNFTYLVADGTGGGFGSTAFRVWDKDLTIFIEAFPNSTYCSWDPETVTEADLIIQNVHGHSSHYDPNECALVVKRTGAIAVGNSQFKSDMTARGVPSSQIVEISPTMGGKVSKSIPSLGINISAYGMDHTYTSGTKVDTYLIEMPNGIFWYHGTCSSGSNTMTYMGNYPELTGLDVMIADTDMNFQTLDNNYYPQTLIKDHDFNSGANPKPATVYENYPTVLKTMVHNQTYRYTMPDHQPELMDRSYAPSEGDPSTEFTFQITYRYRADKAPDTARIIIDGVAHDLPATTGSDWRNGVVYTYKTTLPSGQCKYHFEFSVDGKTVVFPQPDADGPKVNFIPELTNAMVTPSAGDDDDEYVFSILYKDEDNDPPMTRYLVLDGEKYSIPSAGNTFLSGVNYSVKKEIGIGTHSYHFEFTDRMSGARYPAEGEISGPVVVRANYAPTLYQPILSDKSGNRDTVFKFSIGYQDIHGDEPTVREVVIDGTGHEMAPTGTDLVKGVKFECSTKLPIGLHSYFYRFSDGEFDVRNPEDNGNLSGPNVKDRPPEIDLFVPSETEVISDHKPVLLDAANSTDPDGDILSFSWDSNVQGFLGDAPKISVVLKEGIHDITVTVDDGAGSEVNDTFVVNVVHYEAKLKPTMSITPLEPKEGSRVTVKVRINNAGNEAAGETLVKITLDGTAFAERSFTSILAGASVTMQGEFIAPDGHHLLQVFIGDAVGTTIDLNIPARAPPVAEAGTNRSVRVGDDVVFDGSLSISAGSIMAFSWDFGDQMNGTGSKATHVYTAPGTFVVTLTVRDDLGKIGTDTLTVTVLEKKAPPVEKTDESVPIALIIGIAVLVLLLIVAIAVGVLVIVRRSKRAVGPIGIPAPPIIPPGAGSILPGVEAGASPQQDPQAVIGQGTATKQLPPSTASTIQQTTPAQGQGQT
jgi:hypothetical protein